MEGVPPQVNDDNAVPDAGRQNIPPPPAYPPKGAVPAAAPRTRIGSRWRDSIQQKSREPRGAPRKGYSTWRLKARVGAQWAPKAC